MITVLAHGKEAERVAWKAHDLLRREQTLRTTTSDIVVEAREGCLSLKGRVRTNLLRNLAQRLAQSVLNGWQLENELVSDEALALEVAARLAQDPRTADADVRCEVYFGVAHVKGVVASPEQRAAVLEVVAQVPGVTGTKDLLNVAG